MLHNTLQANATQMAPERRGGERGAVRGEPFFMGQSTGVALGGFAAERVGTGAVLLKSQRAPCCCWRSRSPSRAAIRKRSAAVAMG